VNTLTMLIFKNNFLLIGNQANFEKLPMLNNNRHESIPFFKDDGFSVTATEPWFKVKVQVIQNYLQAFVTTAASRADEIVFVDLFSGSGLYSIGHQREIFAGSCLASLSSGLPITKWIFCEEDPHQAKVLHARADKYFKNRDVFVLDDRPEKLMEKFSAIIPQSKGNYRVAVLCLVDPFSIDVPFALIEKLAAFGYSFLMPFTFSLNARHDSNYYLKEQRERLKKFAGNQVERITETQSNLHFYKKLVKIYQQNMLMLGLNTAMSVHKLNSTLMDVPMYYMGYFSRQISPKLIQKDVHGIEQLQFGLF
jgi:three-Cys-motif partner protein